MGGGEAAYRELGRLGGVQRKTRRELPSRTKPQRNEGDVESTGAPG